MGRGLIQEIDGEWKFAFGKHEGKTLEEVAEESPGYLRWVYNEASENLEDDAFHALEDVCGEHDIKVGR